MKWRYEAISALAGSGKTYQLTTRFIGLLSMGVPPEAILAITFTRKAAGEIFDRVVNRLAGAILREKDRKDLGEAVGKFRGEKRYVLKTDDAVKWLRMVLSAIPQLHIGTIDSLFVSIVKAYALELGLPPRQEILEGGALDAAREEALRAALECARRDVEARHGFLEAFKHATAEEHKDVRRVVLDLARNSHGLFLRYPDERAWGDRSRIWPTEMWWDVAEGLTAEGLLARVESFRSRHLAAATDQRYVGAWNTFLERLLAGDFTEALGSTLIQNLAGRLAGLAEGGAEVTYFKKTFTLAGKDAADALLFLAFIARSEIASGLREVNGCYRLMRAYEDAYGGSVRSLGRLSFEDVQLVLAHARESGVKLDIDYRLDGRFDHWMLDEFQDTSARQWSVIGSLADEILQSDAGDRSFFYVGDVKQAIYGWRGGDSTLFEAVQRYYRKLFGDQPSVLDVSWRSSPVVLDAVNRVFGEDLSVPLEGHERVLKRWQRYWQRHGFADKNRELPGRVELHVLGKPDRDDPAAAPPVIEQTCRIVEDLRRRKVPSVAVLVRLNSFGDEVADALRARGIDVRRETNPQLMDNAVVSALLSMLRLADHPGDTFAWRHIQMAGLFDVLRSWAGPAGGESAQEDKLRKGVAARLREDAAVKGVAGLLGDIIDRCRAARMLAGDFVEVRLRQLMDAAMEFDRLSAGTPADFAEHAATLDVKDPVVTGGVVVMTIHKAKGLEFDAVILPDLQGRKREFTHLETGVLVPCHVPSAEDGEDANPADPRDEDGAWIFPFPSRNLCQLDPILSRFRAQAEDDHVYGELCLLYVGMTRARQALYLVTEEPAKSGGGLYASTVLQKTLATDADTAVELDGLKGRLCYALGKPDWFDASSVKAAPVEKPALPADFGSDADAKVLAGRRLVVTTPSEEEEHERLDAAVVLSVKGREGASRGNAMHELFEHVEWFEAGIGKQVVTKWQPRAGVLPDDVVEEVRREFLRALESAEIRAALSRPAGPAELWREQAFEWADRGRWVTGRMDRVVVEKDDAGLPVWATLMDFKSDRVVADEEIAKRVETYRPQMNWYVRALSRLLGLPQDRIRSVLIFTHPARAIGL
ncbi:MAG: ATP-dependent DNA helicase PcrA [Verrucomicrobia bacterium ADurb.Bin345]|nr:MAG: ATP-dependent DNA helicase PcrA [Verrucomicrobia bacterium ADurb.Bin345]